MRFVVYGNCQAASIGTAVRFHRQNDSVHVMGLGPAGSNEKLNHLKGLVNDADYVIAQSPGRTLQLGDDSIAIPEKTPLLHLPTIVFPGFQPDQGYIYRTDKSQLGPIGSYSSKLAIYGLLHRLTPDQTLKLFRPDVYEALGWDFDAAYAAFAAFVGKAGYDISPYFGAWLRHGCFMNTINHPKLRIVSDMTAMALRQAGLDTNDGNCADYVSDPTAAVVWPVTPGMRLPKGTLATTPLFLFTKLEDGVPRAHFVTLADYVHSTHAALEGLTEADLLTEFSGFSLSRMDRELQPFVRALRGGGKTGKAAAASRNPYKGLPDYHFWRKSISGQPLKSINPMVNATMQITPDDRIATAGSCFAQHIAKRLASSGFNYYVAEKPPEGMAAAEAQEKSYGVFSARYGNIYTTRQLLQLIRRAFGTFKPADTVWPSLKDGFLDPFRPEIEPHSTLSISDVLASSLTHLAAVREMFRSLDVFVFTLGLTEAWRNHKDGAVFPLAPGVVSSLSEDHDIEFVNFGFDDVRADLFAFINELRIVNPSARVLLTVSPVPLIATYEERHVLTSTVASKSILRAVADEACRKLADVMYFPSYEIITMAPTKGAYFEADMRQVKASGVDHVMQAFFASCTQKRRTTDKATTAKRTKDVLREIEETAQVICDEETIVASI